MTPILALFNFIKFVIIKILAFSNKIKEIKQLKVFFKFTQLYRIISKRYKKNK